MDIHSIEKAPAQDGYLFTRGQAWFAFAMTLALMIFDYVDRQVIVSLFPYLKAEWDLSDKQLGALVSVVSVTVAVGALPVALFADRVSRVKSIVAMAILWSLATISCMWVRGYSQLLAARSVVGLGEAGYGGLLRIGLGGLGAGRDAGGLDRRPVGLASGLRRRGSSRARACIAVPDGA